MKKVLYLQGIMFMPIFAGAHIILLQTHLIYRGSYMSVHVLLNLLNELGKRDKIRV